MELSELSEKARKHLEALYLKALLEVRAETEAPDIVLQAALPREELLKELEHYFQGILSVEEFLTLKDVDIQAFNEEKRKLVEVTLTKALEVWFTRGAMRMGLR